MVAAASAEAVAFTAAASVGVVFEVEAFEVGVFAVVLTLLAFAADFVVLAFAAAAFMMVVFAAVGSTIAASTMGSSSVILVTRSFPTHTTGTIRIAIILAITLMVTDTAALPAAAFVAAASVVVASVAVAFMAVAFAAVGDPYNQSVYQGSAGYTDLLLVGCEANLPISSNLGGVETP
jgi:hypothetical protein